MSLRSLPAVSLIAALALGASACSSDDEHSQMKSSDSSSADSASGSDTQPDSDSAMAFNDADTMFAQGMIVHHEQAIEMSEIALDPGSGAGTAVVDLATRIQAAQDPEITLLVGLLSDAGKPTAMDSSGGHDMSSMEGMMSAEDMEALEAATGAEFDTMWMEMMIDHHTGAISQAETVVADGKNAEIRTLAANIITAQQAEISEMQGLLAAGE